MTVLEDAALESPGLCSLCRWTESPRETAEALETLPSGLGKAMGMRKTPQDPHLRGCCSQAALCGFTPPGSSGFQGLVLLPIQLWGVQGIIKHQSSLPKPSPTLTSHLLHAKLGGFPPPGEGFAPQVSALPLPFRSRRAASFMSPISPSRRSSERLLLTRSALCLAMRCHKSSPSPSLSFAPDLW